MFNSFIILFLYNLHIVYSKWYAKLIIMSNIILEFCSFISQYVLEVCYFFIFLPFPFGDLAGGEGGVDGDEALGGAAFETQSELLVVELERAVDYYVDVVEQGA